MTEHPDVAGAPRELPLAGRVVGVTAARKADEQRAVFERRGARVVAAPALRTIPVVDDERVRAATQRALAAPADAVVLTTATGFRWWVEACQGWGLEGPLHELLARVPLYSRGPKVTGVLRAAGLREHAAAVTEASPELLAMLVDAGVAGRTVAVQVQGAGGSYWNPVAGLLDGLRAAGAEVIEIPVYRWELPEDTGPLDELVALVADARLDCVTFTSAPAAAALLERADALGLQGRVGRALGDPVVALCVGPVTAAPLVARGIEVSMPDRMRLGALLAHATEVLAARPAVN